MRYSNLYTDDLVKCIQQDLCNCAWLLLTSFENESYYNSINPSCMEQIELCCVLGWGTLYNKGEIPHYEDLGG